MRMMTASRFALVELLESLNSSTTTVKGVGGCDTTADPQCATDLTTTRTYSAAGPLDHEQRAGGGVTSYSYDSRRRVASIARGPSMTDLREKIEYAYSTTSGRKTLEVYLAKEGTSWIEKKRESFSYDTLDQMSAITHADNSSMGYTYRDDGKLAGVRDENHASANTTYDYDPAGRMKKVTQKLGAGSVVTLYGYDIHGNLKSVTDPNGNVTTYVYDDFGQMLKQISPVTGTTSYAYDSAGNLMTMTDANDVLTTRTYDALNRLRTEDADPQIGPIAGDPYHIEWGYGDGVGNGGGRLAGFIDTAGVTNYIHDRRGLLMSEERFMRDQEWYVTRYRYDSDGNRVAIDYPFGKTVTYAYDYAGRPLSASLPGSTLAQGAKYLPFGPLTELTFGNGTVKTEAHDARYRVTENKLALGSNPIARYSYAYDAAGNITSIHDLVDSGYDRSFGYDDLNRLVTANTGTSLWGAGAYTYDAMGNMLSVTLGTQGVPLARQSTFHYQTTTPLLASVDEGVNTPVVYDDAGNETGYRANREYTSNRMTFVTRPSPGPGESLSVGYEYDARGLRVTRTEYWSDTTEVRHFIYSPEMKLLAVAHADLTNNGGLFRQRTNAPPQAGDSWLYGIVWFGDLPIVQLEGGILPVYTFTDHLGTPILQTNDTGMPRWRAEYEPFGSIWKQRAGTAELQPLRFPGQESALTWEGAEENYNIFRWYRAGWGRYTQADPMGLSASDVNLYRYADSNPLSFTDPNGLVTVRQTFTRRGSLLGGGGVYSLAYARVSAAGTCVCTGSSWYIRLTLDFNHGYLCGSKKSCAIELWHANIASAFISRAAKEWNKYEAVPYTDAPTCRSDAAFWARDLELNILNPRSWPPGLPRQLNEAQQNYEDTHHGVCALFPGSCGAY